MLNDWGNEFLNKFGSADRPNLQGKKIVFLVRNLGISGGTNMILGHASHLARLGAQITLAVTHPSEGNGSHLSGSRLRIRPLSKVRKEHFDLAFATFWTTVYSLPKLQASVFAYFVQSLETRFALNGNKNHWSEKQSEIALTYRVGLPVIAVSDWLANFLRAHSNAGVWMVRNGIDKEIFASPDSPLQQSLQPLRILLEGNPDAPFKAVRETAEALENVQDIEITLVSPSEHHPVKGVDKTFVSVSNSQMCSIYKSHDVLVKMSRVEGLYGPPIEAFHSGITCITSAVTGHQEIAVHKVNSLVVDVDDFDGLRAAVEKLKLDRELLLELKKGALRSASLWPSLSDSGDDFAKVCCYLLMGPDNNEEVIASLEKLVSFRAQQISMGRLPMFGIPSFSRTDV